MISENNNIKLEQDDKVFYLTINGVEKRGGKLPNLLKNNGLYINGVIIVQQDGAPIFSILERISTRNNKSVISIKRFISHYRLSGYTLRPVAGNVTFTIKAKLAYCIQSHSNDTDILLDSETRAIQFNLIQNCDKYPITDKYYITIDRSCKERKLGNAR
mgnify:CR=1 FL=1